MSNVAMRGPGREGSGMKAVIYSRFSSAGQREASHEDQARNCKRRIESEGWKLIEHYRDSAISGSVRDRPAYQRMLEAAERREFSIILIDDLSRLSRDQVESERTIRRLEFSGIRIIAVSDAYDSESKGRKVQRGIKSLMNEVYLDDLRDKTHRGLTGQALLKYWAGGKVFGYRLKRITDPTARDKYGQPLAIGSQLEIDPEQAKVVRDVFESYAAEHSPRAIADALNRRKIPSPGSTWKRSVRRAHGWMGSSVRVILDNPLYRGTYIWNKRALIKDPESGKRRARMRPASDWITHQMPELAIISPALWARVERRRKDQSADVSDGRRKLGGGISRYLFSGIIRCDCCKAAFTIIGGQGAYKSYGCSSRREGGRHNCSNSLSVRLHVLENRLLDTIRGDLLTPEVIAEVEARVIARLKKPVAAPSNRVRIEELEGEITNLCDAIAAGQLRSSTALGQRLAKAEEELARLKGVAEMKPKATLLRFPGQIEDRHRQLVADLDKCMAEDVNRSRSIIRQLIGDTIYVKPATAGEHLIAMLPRGGEALLRAAGSLQLAMVAGACSVNIRRRRAIRKAA